ncbi:hypothetical protein [Labrenzia sp. DG1229]|uniref:hypothetical protein n=1 Tax=Labrenzia sp. DG1229 TaxID=681847 RepID=UPI000568C9EA|nr:hypothetical protein [Labrenzia sp. DG1229]
MSIQLELKIASGTPIYRGHDHYWSVIRDLGKNADFSLAEIAARSNDRTNKSISEFVNRLVRAGFLEVVRTERGPTARGGLVGRHVYRLARNQVRTPILDRKGKTGTQGLGNSFMWNAMRSLTFFDKHELSLTASTPDVQISVSTAFTYAMHLERAGYLNIVRKGKSTTPTKWRLKPSMNTGPDAPKILRSKMVYDVNRGQIMGSPVAEECAA